MSSSSSAAAASSSGGSGVTVQILHFSDWHGQLDPIPGSSGAPATGGAQVLKAYFDEDKAQNANTIITTGGDEFGASPPVVSLSNEEPAVKALNLMGLQVSTLGNHNFDKGISHLDAMLAEANYTVVSSNLAGLSTAGLDGTGEVVAPFHIQDVAGVKVAFIGLTNLDAPELTTPGNMGPLTVSANMAAAVGSANNARTAAAAQGATVFVVLAHMGITTRFTTPPAVGPLATLADALGGTNFDLLLGDHTNFSLNTVINGLPTVECLSQGREYARIALSLDTSNQVTAVNVTMVPTTLAGLPSGRQAEVTATDNPITTMLAPYRLAVETTLNVKIGEATVAFPFGGTPPQQRVQENSVANLVADSMLWSDVLFGEPATVNAALINGGGVRAALPSSYNSTGISTLCRPTTSGNCTNGQPLDLVLGDAFTILPFGNGIAWVTASGQDIWRALENGIDQLPAANGKYPQVSGLSFDYDVSRTAGDRVLFVQMWDGTVVLNDTTQTFTVAMSDFLFYGGDGYGMFRNNASTVRPQLMADALAAYINYFYLGMDGMPETADDGTVSPVVDGRNGKVAKVLINEVSPNITAGATFPYNSDMVELLVLEAGNLLGLRLDAIGPATPENLARFGDRPVAAGDIILVHLMTTANITAAGLAPYQYESALDGCDPMMTIGSCSNTAWDVVGSGTALAFTRRILVVRDGKDAIQDAVALVDPANTMQPQGTNFDPALKTVQDANQWLPATCTLMSAPAPCTNATTPTINAISVDWTGAGTTLTGNSVQRKLSNGAPVDTHQASDWETKAGTLGAAN